MTAMKPILDVLIDANVVLILAYCLWRATQGLIARSGLRHDYGRQLVLLKSVLLFTVLSPIVAYFGIIAGQSLAPRLPLTFSDIAVAAFLRGDIAIPAVEFETILNTRARLMDGFLEAQAPLAVAARAAFVAIMAFFVLRTCWSLCCVRSALDGSIVWRRTKHVDIRVSDTTRVPFAARTLFRRHVVLPSSLMTRPQELRFVLAHEFEHLRAGDVEWEMAIELMRPLLFWNPAFILWKRSFDHLREVSCDQRVIVSKRIAPQDYARCLLDFCERQLTGGLPRAMNVAFVRSDVRAARRVFENRIMAMSHVPTGGGSGVIMGLVVVLGVGVSMAAASVRQPGDWSHDRIMLSTIVNLERLEARNQGL